MTDERLNSWLASVSVLPDVGRIGVFNAWPELDLPGVEMERVRAVQPMAGPHKALVERGFNTAKVVNYRYDAVILRLPRQKALALAYLKDAVRRIPDNAPIIVDGQKTDGIESFLKLCRKRFDVREVVSKAHGKLFWFEKAGLEEDVMKVLDLPEMTPRETSSGFCTAPGVFSADGPDAASVFLAEHLPVLRGCVVDLGAGWGYLSRRILEKSQPDALHLVEADYLAVQCAEKNVTDDVAVFHWDDALSWKPERAVDHVVMNPPFHQGRAVDARLGQDFIRAAARLLEPKGSLWLVANRHLPYETVLEDTFRSVQPLAQTPSFKLFHATSPKRSRKG
ncbi:MAG: class I SAM-dependent methyltransferase [Boseongicola sp.]|nr:class I SAM-dependent methyltransferase [Boseongicola sp.]NNJ67755.1 class I SAM-dependent methyltransferase [Boseongicola sp.]